MGLRVSWKRHCKLTSATWVYALTQRCGSCVRGVDFVSKKSSMLSPEWRRTAAHTLLSIS